MRSLLLVLTLLLLPGTASASVPTTIKIADRWIFRVVVPVDDNKSLVGTAFCQPGTSAPRLLTAAHATGPGMFVLDRTQKRHEVKVYFKDADRDVAVLVLDDASKVCDLNPFQWAKRSPEVGEDIWVVGYPTNVDLPLKRKGTLASEEGFHPQIPGRRASIFHALKGDSGSPVFDSAGNVIGIEQGGTENGVIDFYLPVEQIRKVIK
jgi:S1-C subfamily serine protease